MDSSLSVVRGGVGDIGIIDSDHLQDFWYLALAPGPPYFLGSQRLGSATRSERSYWRRSSLISLFSVSLTYFWQQATTPLERACLMAQICETYPPPLTRMRMSRAWNRLRPRSRMGSRTLARRDWGSRSSMGEPLTLRTPLPARTDATATEFFLRPKHWTRLFFTSDIWFQNNQYFNILSINNYYPSHTNYIQRDREDFDWNGFRWDIRNKKLQVSLEFISFYKRIQLPMEQDIPKRKIRIVAISDTHDKQKNLNPADWPQADIFIHAGDFTRASRLKQFQKFRAFLKSLPYKHKIVIPGNHDFGVDSQEVYDKVSHIWSVKQKEKVVPEQEIQRLKEVCTFLIHDYVEVEGLKIFGSPYTLADYQMGFTYKHVEADAIWGNLPEKVDILVTHQPPFGIRDAICKPVYPGASVGCKRLREAVEMLEPKLHIFGHIHESHGDEIIGKTHFYNVAYLNQEYMPSHKPILIELEVDQPKQ